MGRFIEMLNENHGPICGSCKFCIINSCSIKSDKTKITLVAITNNGSIPIDCNKYESE